MRITRQAQSRSCAVCERTLLMGERATRFAPNGDGEYVDVCPLCQEIALDAGWVKEGSPTTPMVPAVRRKRQSPLSSFLGFRRESSAAPVADEPILRRLSEPELAMVEGADIFNASQFRRTVEGIAKSLGDPKSILESITSTNYQSIVGPVRWAGQPVKNVTKTPLVSGQWQRKNNAFDLVITQNETAKNIPVGGKLELLS